jgi:hypothetical protein
LSAEIELDTDGLISLGEDLDLEGWVLVDERDVDYDLEDELDEQLKNWKPKQNLFQKLASAVKAIPNAKSSQDKVVNDIQWKVRYQYTGNPNPERAFCKTMMSANKIYRKEDLENIKVLDTITSLITCFYSKEDQDATIHLNALHSQVLRVQELT